MTMTSSKPRTRTHKLSVEVIQDSKWGDAVCVVAVLCGAHDIRRIGEKYPPTAKGKVVKNLTLVNFPDGDGGLDKAILWGKAKSLKVVDPRTLFAIKVGHPELHKKLGQKGVNLVETTGCVLNHTGFPDKRHLCCVVLGDSVPTVGLFPVNQFNGFGSNDTWFVLSE